jgi:hypothetical protein
MALFYLTRMLHQSDGSEQEGVLCIPPYFETQVMFILGQAFYLLARLEPSTDGVLFSSDDPDSPNHPEAVNTLLRALGIEWIDVSNKISSEIISKLLVECLERIQQPQSSRHAVLPPKPHLESDKMMLDSVKRRVIVTKTTIGKINWLHGAGSHLSTEAHQAELEDVSAEEREGWCIEGETWLKDAATFTGEMSNIGIGRDIGFINSML